MKTVVVWDIDDVIYPWYDRAHEACVKAELGEAVKIKPTTWEPYNHYGVEPQAWYDVLALATHSGWLYGGEPDPEALEIIYSLDRAGVEQHFITARGFLAHGDLIREQTQAMMVKHAIPHASLVFSRDKGADALAVNATHAIDDNVGNFLSLSEVGVDTYLMDRPWNASHIVPSNRRITDLKQFARVIKRGVHQ